ncbi:TetR/AcrR family transcriptional regulator [Pectobacterium actinidiae]|uniref:TetR/AcrR family transcriptional regulator n=1 Tax=Pectobacterium actinidiae TaxID=1507808 RepID=UPI004040C338
MKSSVQDVRKHILDTAYGIIATKGFSGVGINEILTSSGIPKGSFYYYFGTKEAFGEALLAEYFDTYLTRISGILSASGESAGIRLMRYFSYWADSQSSTDATNKCLAVKLGAEVSDMSEIMRLALDRGTRRVVLLLETTLREGLSDGSLSVSEDPMSMAEMLYNLWLGACVRQKITRDSASLKSTLNTTRALLNIKL